MPANYRERTALVFDAKVFHGLLDTARKNAGHTWVDVSKETGVGIDTFRRLRNQPSDRPENVIPRLNQYLSMAAYIRTHATDIPDAATAYMEIGAHGKLYTEEPAA